MDDGKYTINDVAEGLGLGRWPILWLCYTDIIAHEKVEGEYFLTNRGVAEVIYLILERRCANSGCGKKIPTSRTMHARYCSKQCQQAVNSRAQYERNIRIKNGEEKLDYTRLKGWKLELYRELKRHKVPRNEERVTHLEALTLSTLTLTQLTEATRLRIFSTKPVFVSEGQQEPYEGYAVSQLEIARKVIKKWRSLKQAA